MGQNSKIISDFLPDERALAAAGLRGNQVDATDSRLLISGLPMSEETRLTRLDELVLAFDLCDGAEECEAYVSRLTGEVVLDNEMISGKPCPVEDIAFDDDYLVLPTKRQLDLGTRLVWRFVHREIPGLEPKIREMFSRRGAYRRWKDFLADNDLLDQWHQFEEQATEEALLAWCRENEIPIEGKDSDPP